MGSSFDTPRFGYVGIAIAVILLAALFRLSHLGSIPPGLFGDEAANGLVAASIRRLEQFPVYVEEPEETKWGSREPLYHYLMAGVFSAFGENATAIRLTSALVGIATVAVFLLVCLRLFDRRAAMLTAILLAVGKWHVIASRIGLRAILVPLWIVLVLWALEAAVRNRTLDRAIIFGVVLGLGFYTYPAFWVVPFCLVLVWMASRRNEATTRNGQRSAWSLLLIGTAAALVTMLPLIRYAAEKPDYFFARVARAGAFGADDRERTESLRDNAQKVLFMLHFRGDRNPRHDIPGEPLLDPLSGVLFLVGLYQVGKRAGLDHTRQVGLFAFWLLPLLPSALADSAPHALRALGAAPSVYLIAGLGWSRLSRVRIVGPIIALLAGIAIVGINYRDYFQRWATNPAVIAGFNTDAARFFEYIAEAAKTEDVYVSEYVYTSPQLRFLGLQTPDAWQTIADETAFVAHADRHRDRLFVSDGAEVNALIEWLYEKKAEVVGRYSVPSEGKGRIYRVRSEDLRKSLDDIDMRVIRRILDRSSSDAGRGWPDATPSCQAETRDGHSLHRETGEG